MALSWSGRAPLKVYEPPNEFLESRTEPPTTETVTEFLAWLSYAVRCTCTASQVTDQSALWAEAEPAKSPAPTRAAIPAPAITADRLRNWRVFLMFPPWFCGTALSETPGSREIPHGIGTVHLTSNDRATGGALYEFRRITRGIRAGSVRAAR